MKTRVVQLLIIVSKAILRFIYSFLKIFPVNENKVVFCSRQSSSLPLDFQLIQDCLIKECSEIKCVSICCRVTNSIKSYIQFLFAVLKSMYHLATSKVCILDSYWPAACMLNHKDDLTIIQIWHALGKLKKSGHASVGKKSGRKQEYAKLIHMHENYDYVIAGGKAWNKFYCESFNIKEYKILNYGLPRIDYLLDTEADNREKFYIENPNLKNKKIVLYAPTFRRNMGSRWNDIVSIADSENIALIIKKHPGEKANKHIDKKNVMYFDHWNTIDLISICDYLITDYSAIALEAAVLNKKTFFWVYDYDDYIENNGLNINLYGLMSSHVFKNISKLKEYIEKDIFDEKKFSVFKDKYLPRELRGATNRITRLIVNCLKTQNGVCDNEICDNGRW